MSKNPFIFTQEMAELLKKIRLKSGLSQSELAERIGLSKKTGYSYISHLEKGFLKNPSLGTILMYLRICGVSWPEFFQKLDTIDFKMRHEKMISQLPPPASQRKIQRDAMRYEIGVEFPSKEKEEIDFARLKKIIKEKVEVLVNKEEDTLTPTLSYQRRGRSAVYEKFAMEYFEFMASLNKPGMKMVIEKYQRAGLARHLLFKIKKIIFSIIGAEIKRIEAKKPLPTAKQERMAVGFTRYRIRMERIEAAVQKVLCELGVQASMGKFALYKDFARECYGILKRYYGRESLTEKLREITQRWVKEGLKEDVLEKVKETTINVFTGKKV
jgi:transcriptional regulator with XRE-family HTH domain